MTDPLADLIESVLPDIIALRHELHAHPELSRREHQTARRVRDALADLPGVELLPPLMETDVVAVLNASREGPCLALRADLDALPIREETDVPYRSTVPDVMHACGHDGHTAILVGTARALSHLADTLPGKVKFIFQPDEEHNGGARVLCERGVLEAPAVDAAIALHGWPAAALGTIAVRRGPAMAASTMFEITIRGRGGHGAYPHRTVDPVVIAAYVVTALQSIVARNVDPLDSAVVTVGQITAGAAENVIPPECFLMGTLRYLKAETGQTLRRRLGEIVEYTARAHQAHADLRFIEGYPPMSNDPALTGLIEQTARDLLGADHVKTDEPPTMGVEDFAYFAQRVPAAMFNLGLRPRGADDYPGLHTPRFDFNDNAIPIGIHMFCELTRRFLTASGNQHP